jgi:hypothetical protein
LAGAIGGPLGGGLLIGGHAGSVAQLRLLGRVHRHGCLGRVGLRVGCVRARLRLGVDHLRDVVLTLLAGLARELLRAGLAQHRRSAAAPSRSVPGVT